MKLIRYMVIKVSDNAMIITQTCLLLLRTYFHAESRDLILLSFLLPTSVSDLLNLIYHVPRKEKSDRSHILHMTTVVILRYSFLRDILSCGYSVHAGYSFLRDILFMREMHPLP